jgi:thymidylate synthase (FAD)
MSESNVKLISITTGLGELQGKTAEEVISYAARVSNPANQENFDTAPKLLGYLIKNKHWSPLEMASMCLEIETSRGVAPQILRHRSFSFQEFSQRYAESSDFKVYNARRQDQKNRQNSIDDMSDLDKKWFEFAQNIVIRNCNKLYKQALEKGIAKELARFLLPSSTTTKLYMNGTIRSWVHYIELRTDPGTQKEHREIAEQCKTIFCEQLPNIAKALEWR